MSAPAEAVLRLYRNDKEVVLECPSAAPECRGGGLAAELALSAPGAYRAVVLLPVGALGRSTGSLDEDLTQCRCQSRLSAAILAQ